MQMGECMRGKSTFLLLVVLLSVSSVYAEAPNDAAATAAVGVRPEAIRAHIRFLADDLLEGRAPGTRGYDLAARYVASQFEQLGLVPAGPDNSYYQPVPLRRSDLAEVSFVLLREGREQALQNGQDFLAAGHEVLPQATVEAPLLFVGYGVTAPDQQYDDYAGVDARGKIVVVLFGAPARFPTAIRAHYSADPLKTANAVAHGAVGYIVVWPPQSEKAIPWALLVLQSKLPNLRWLDPSETPNDARPQLRGRAMMSRRGAETLFAGASQSLDQVFAEAEAGRPSSFALPATARIRTASRHVRIDSSNVVAVLPGSDFKLKGEYVVYSAHLDHLGIGDPVQGQTIYHGALDNASGVAALLEIARTFGRLSAPPRRSILFLAVTGEENGLLGSGYFARYPTVPSSQLVANLNMDGAAILFPFRDVVAFGADYSSLGMIAGREAERMHVKVIPDPRPEEVTFIRSDQYSFVKQGIPALFLSMGDDSGDPQRKGGAIFQEWIAARYHTPQDDFRQPLDYEAAAQFTRLNFLVGFEVAQQDARPEWTPESFFGKQFGRKTARTGQN